MIQKSLKKLNQMNLAANKPKGPKTAAVEVTMTVGHLKLC